MSHIHHLSDSNGAAAEYQDYLERLKQRKLRTFDSAIDADRGAEGHGQQETETEAEPEAKQEPEAEQPAKRYA